jgi:tetratricopeptide (TPR) repeat protein
VNIAMASYSQAYGAYKQAIALQPDSVEALQGLAQLTLLLGDLGSSKNFVQTLLVLAPRDVRGRLVQASIALREQRYDDCSAIIASLEQDEVNVDDLYLLKAQFLAATGKPADAATLLETRLASSDQKAGILDALLKIYQQQGNKAAIESVYQRLNAAQPGDPDAALKYAGLLYREGRAADAGRIVAALEARNVGKGDVAVQIAQFWSDVAPAAVALPQMLRIANQGGPQRKATIAFRLIEIGQAPAAYGLLDPLVDSASVDAENISAQIAYAYALRGIGRSADARARADEVLEFDTTNSRALLLRAELSLAKRDLNQALSDGQLLVSVEPDFERGAILLAQIYAARGNRTLADQGFGRALSDFPNSLAVLHANLDYLIATGRLADGAKVATRFALAHPQSAEAQAIRTDLCRKAGASVCADDGLDSLYPSLPVQARQPAASGIAQAR